MSGIFISYRRDDSQGFAGRLADDLGEQLGTDRVFRDIEIPAGSDFGEILRRAIAASDVLLVVIGRRWLTPTSGTERSRLFDANDWVRAEIEAALKQGKHLIPVLVGGARIPAADALPDSIRRLCQYQAAVLTDRGWDREVEALAKRLRVLSPSLRRREYTGEPVGHPLGDALREIGERLADEIGERQREPSLPSPTLPPTWVQRALRNVGQGLKRFTTFAVAAALVYVGIRLFGDQAWLDGLDQVEARLQMGWGRLQAYFGRL